MKLKRISFGEYTINIDGVKLMDLNDEFTNACLVPRENQINIRKGICEKLTFMGVDVDADANNMRGEEKVISKPDSKVKVYVIPTNEELMIAKETQRLVNII